VEREKTFRQADFGVELRLPDGSGYVDAHGAEEIREALESGLAAFVEGCNGKAFIWRDGGIYRVDHFYLGRAKGYDFDSEEEAVDYAAELCE